MFLAVRRSRRRTCRCALLPSHAVVCLVWATASSVAWSQLPDGLGKDLTVQVCGKEAEAIVKYQENGAFKIVDDLKKVPDLDFKKIEAKKDRLAL